LQTYVIWENWAIPFDTAISSQVIEHASSDTKMLREVYKILKPKGILYIPSVLSKKSFGCTEITALNLILPMLENTNPRKSL